MRLAIDGYLSALEGFGLMVTEEVEVSRDTRSWSWEGGHCRQAPGAPRRVRETKGGRSGNRDEHRSPAELRSVLEPEPVVTIWTDELLSK